ncbi:hypothetical protein B0H14DRAFT_2631067 [Mycena olivaceomarginata]|nr:hypothetical protein B0H14DRAFT_2631067 [Mycena olivaceomarginata]
MAKGLFMLCLQGPLPKWLLRCRQSGFSEIQNFNKSQIADRNKFLAPPNFPTTLFVTGGRLEAPNVHPSRRFTKLAPQQRGRLLEISLKDAVEVLEDSAEYGRLFNADNSARVNILVTPSDNEPPRHRKVRVKLTKRPSEDEIRQRITIAVRELADAIFEAVLSKISEKPVQMCTVESTKLYYSWFGEQKRTTAPITAVIFPSNERSDDTDSSPTKIATTKLFQNQG